MVYAALGNNYARGRKLWKQQGADYNLNAQSGRFLMDRYVVLYDLTKQLQTGSYTCNKLQLPSSYSKSIPN